MPGEAEDQNNVIDTKKIGFLRHMLSPSDQDYESYVTGLEGAEGKSKTNELKIYGPDHTLIETINVVDDSVLLKFVAERNTEYLPLIEANNQEYDRSNHFVKASDILYKIKLAKKGKHGYALIPGTQIDEIPENEELRKYFLKFEEDLGHALYKNSEVIKLSEIVKMKCLELLSGLNKKPDEDWDQNSLKSFLTDLETKFSSTDPDPSIAGITKSEKTPTMDEDKTGTIESVFLTQGNIREVMTILMNLAREKDFIVAKGYDKTLLDPEVKKNIKAVGDGRLAGKAKSDHVQKQPETRGSAGKNPFLIEKSTQKVDDENLNLTENEKAAQKSKDDLVKWSEGQNVWRPNEEDPFVQVARKLLLPIKAGPSGTTDRLFQLNDVFHIGIAPKNFVALVIAYILPINAHSLIEVGAAALPYMNEKASNDVASFYAQLMNGSPIVGKEMQTLLNKKSNFKIKQMIFSYKEKV
jgi:hypothetical protein